MLVFDEGWNIRELWKKSEGKMVNSAIFGQNCSLVPVPNRGGTGTTYAEANWYRYHPSGTGTTLQNKFGTSTKHSGTGTTGSCNPDFWYFCIVKL